jgi:hypothetical protein
MENNKTAGLAIVAATTVAGAFILNQLMAKSNNAR